MSDLTPGAGEAHSNIKVGDDDEHGQATAAGEPPVPPRSDDRGSDRAVRANNARVFDWSRQDIGGESADGTLRFRARAPGHRSVLRDRDYSRSLSSGEFIPFDQITEYHLSSVNKDVGGYEPETMFSIIEGEDYPTPKDDRLPHMRGKAARSFVTFADINPPDRVGWPECLVQLKQQRECSAELLAVAAIGEYKTNELGYIYKRELLQALVWYDCENELNKHFVIAVGTESSDSVILAFYHEAIHYSAITGRIPQEVYDIVVEDMATFPDSTWLDTKYSSLSREERVVEYLATMSCMSLEVRSEAISRLDEFHDKGMITDGEYANELVHINIYLGAEGNLTPQMRGVYRDFVDNVYANKGIWTHMTAYVYTHPASLSANNSVGHTPNLFPNEGAMSKNNGIAERTIENAGSDLLAKFRAASKVYSATVDNPHNAREASVANVARVDLAQVIISDPALSKRAEEEAFIKNEPHSLLAEAHKVLLLAERAEQEVKSSRTALMGGSVGERILARVGELKESGNDASLRGFRLAVESSKRAGELGAAPGAQENRMIEVAARAVALRDAKTAVPVPSEMSEAQAAGMKYASRAPGFREAFKAQQNNNKQEAYVVNEDQISPDAEERYEQAKLDVAEAQAVAGDFDGEAADRELASEEARDEAVVDFAEAQATRDEDAGRRQDQAAAFRAAQVKRDQVQAEAAREQARVAREALLRDEPKDEERASKASAEDYIARGRAAGANNSPKNTANFSGHGDDEGLSSGEGEAAVPVVETTEARLAREGALRVARAAGGGKAPALPGSEEEIPLRVRALDNRSPFLVEKAQELDDNRHYATEATRLLDPRYERGSYMGEDKSIHYKDGSINFDLRTAFLRDPRDLNIDQHILEGRPVSELSDQSIRRIAHVLEGESLGASWGGDLLLQSDRDNLRDECLRRDALRISGTGASAEYVTDRHVGFHRLMPSKERQSWMENDVANGSKEFLGRLKDDDNTPETVLKHVESAEGAPNNKERAFHLVQIEKAVLDLEAKRGPVFEDFNKAGYELSKAQNEVKAAQQDLEKACNQAWGGIHRVPKRPAMPMNGVVDNDDLEKLAVFEDEMADYKALTQNSERSWGTIITGKGVGPAFAGRLVDQANGRPGPKLALGLAERYLVGTKFPGFGPDQRRVDAMAAAKRAEGLAEKLGPLLEDLKEKESNSKWAASRVDKAQRFLQTYSRGREKASNQFTDVAFAAVRQSEQQVKAEFKKQQGESLKHFETNKGRIGEDIKTKAPTELSDVDVKSFASSMHGKPVETGFADTHAKTKFSAQEHDLLIGEAKARGMLGESATGNYLAATSQEFHLKVDCPERRQRVADEAQLGPRETWAAKAKEVAEARKEAVVADDGPEYLMIRGEGDARPLAAEKVAEYWNPTSNKVGKDEFGRTVVNAGDETIVDDGINIQFDGRLDRDKANFFVDTVKSRGFDTISVEGSDSCVALIKEEAAKQQVNVVPRAESKDFVSNEERETLRGLGLDEAEVNAATPKETSEILGASSEAASKAAVDQLRRRVPSEKVEAPEVDTASRPVIEFSGVAKKQMDPGEVMEFWRARKAKNITMREDGVVDINKGGKEHIVDDGKVISCEKLNPLDEKSAEKMVAIASDRFSDLHISAVRSDDQQFLLGAAVAKGVKVSLTDDVRQAAPGLAAKANNDAEKKEVNENISLTGRASRDVGEVKPEQRESFWQKAGATATKIKDNVVYASYSDANVVDRGNSIESLNKINPKSANQMAEAMKSRGVNDVTISKGSQKDREMLARACVKAGLKVSNKDLEHFNQKDIDHGLATEKKTNIKPIEMEKQWKEAFKDTRLKDIERGSSSLTVHLHDGSRITDSGNSLLLRDGKMDQQKADAMMKVASARGWGDEGVNLRGDRATKQMLCRAAARQEPPLKINNKEMQEFFREELESVREEKVKQQEQAKGSEHKHKDAAKVSSAKEAVIARAEKLNDMVEDYKVKPPSKEEYASQKEAVSNSSNEGERVDNRDRLMAMSKALFSSKHDLCTDPEHDGTIKAYAKELDKALTPHQSSKATHKR